MHVRLVVLSALAVVIGISSAAFAYAPETSDHPQPVVPAGAAIEHAGGESASDPAAGDDPAAPLSPLIAPQTTSKPAAKPEPEGFQAKPALLQAGLFLGIQQGFRFGQVKTQRELGGPFFKDWFASVRGLHGWKDGGRQFTNYVAHPMYGAMTGFIFVQNDSSAKRQEFGLSGDYWKSRLKAAAWTAAVSTQFELGPVSQASLGNVGAGHHEANKMGVVDLVLTPSLGLVWMVLEDALDRHFLQRIEARTSSVNTVRILRLMFNPMHGAANLLRFRMLWYKDYRPIGQPQGLVAR
jgi:hypothetical protein